MARLLLFELSYAGQLEQMKRKLTSQFDFSAQQLYRELDDCNMQFIDFVSMKRFLQKCGIVMSSCRIIAIVRRLDVDADAKLSKSEFMEAITPQEPIPVNKHLSAKYPSVVAPKSKRPKTATGRNGLLKEGAVSC